VIEVFPLETTVFGEEDQGQAMSGRNPLSSSSSAAYGSLGMQRSADVVYALAQQEGWRATQPSGSTFEVIELWVENQVLLELITPEVKATSVVTNLRHR
jgi:hypothetical protein